MNEWGPQPSDFVHPQRQPGVWSFVLCLALNLGALVLGAHIGRALRGE